MMIAAPFGLERPGGYQREPGLAIPPAADAAQVKAMERLTELEASCSKLKAQFGGGSCRAARIYLKSHRHPAGARNS